MISDANLDQITYEDLSFIIQVFDIYLKNLQRTIREVEDYNRYNPSAIHATDPYLYSFNREYDRAAAIYSRLVNTYNLHKDKK